MILQWQVQEWFYRQKSMKFRLYNFDFTFRNGRCIEFYDHELCNEVQNWLYYAINSIEVSTHHKYFTKMELEIVL